MVRAPAWRRRRSAAGAALTLLAAACASPDLTPVQRPLSEAAGLGDLAAEQHLRLGTLARAQGDYVTACDAYARAASVPDCGRRVSCGPDGSALGAQLLESFAATARKQLQWARSEQARASSCLVRPAASSSC